MNYREKISADQIPNGIITLRMLAAANIFAAFARDQKGRIELSAGVKIQVNFSPVYTAGTKPIFRLWGYAPGNEGDERGIDLHELTNAHFIISCDRDAVAVFTASESASEYLTGTVVE
jgi:hypothetical protein